METEAIQTVSQLTDSIKYTLSSDFPDVWVSGEVSGLSYPQSGHVYLTLKDPSAQLSTIIWRSTVAKLRFALEDGMQVLIRGHIDVYPQRGSYQLIARSVQPLGQGGLQLAFRKLHDRLKKEGLFDEVHKQKLPRVPRRVAVITSSSGAAIHDFLQVVTRRWPHLDILIVPVKVQGPEAAPEIAAAIKQCSRKFDFAPQVIVVTRGGGSIEDLWAFNEEIVVRAIRDCPVPVISAVGHEIDITLSDLAADVRALTPSEAGEKLVPDVGDIMQLLHSSGQRIRRLIMQTVGQSRERLIAIENRTGIRQPLGLIHRFGMRLDTAESKLSQISQRKFEVTRNRLLHFLEILKMSLRTAIPESKRRLKHLVESSQLGSPIEMIHSRRRQLNGRHVQLLDLMLTEIQLNRRQLEIAEGKLKAFNPENVLKRGYSLTVDAAGRPLVDCQNVKTGDTIQTWLSAGKMVSHVEEIEAESNYFENG